jgi:hypothetical protein
MEQEIIGEAGVIPARSRHCDSLLRKQEGKVRSPALSFYRITCGTQGEIDE